MTRQYRKYDKKTKLAAVMAAEMGGVVQAERQTGIPHNTIAYWLEQPEFAEFRRKTREQMADEIRTVAALAWKRVAQALADGSMEGRDALFAADKATSLTLLMSGEATNRSEHRSLGDDLDDHERATLKRAILDELARREAAASDSGAGLDATTAPDGATQAVEPVAADGGTGQRQD